MREKKRQQTKNRKGSGGQVVKVSAFQSQPRGPVFKPYKGSHP